MIQSHGPSVAEADVRAFWEANPLTAALNPHPLGTMEYFEYYDRMREANETPEFSERMHEYSRFGGRRVLDVGCGNGYVMSRYAMAGAAAHGVDLTHRGATLTQARLRLLDLEGAVLQGSAERLPYATASFDCVCSMGVLHHVPNPEAAIAEIHRVLRPGGRLIVMLYHRNSALFRVRFPLEAMAVRRSRQDLVNAVDGQGNPKGDVYSRSQVRRLLAPFKDLELEVHLLEPWMVTPRGARLLPRQMMRPLEGVLGWFLYARGYR